MVRAATLFLIAVTAVLTQGCKTNAKNYSLPHNYHPSMDEGSMFASDQAVLANDDIERILTTQFSTPPHARLAVMKLNRGNNYWSENSAMLDEKGTNAFLSALRGSPSLASASVLPSLLVPQRVTVPYLREAAARYQADLLFVYRIDTTEYQKYRFIKEDQIKARCTIEAVLLDVRSGIVPFTTLATQEISAQAQSTDLTFDETTDHAYHAAEEQALLQVARQLRGYLESTG